MEKRKKIKEKIFRKGDYALFTSVTKKGGCLLLHITNNIKRKKDT